MSKSYPLLIMIFTISSFVFQLQYPNILEEASPIEYESKIISMSFIPYIDKVKKTGNEF